MSASAATKSQRKLVLIEPDFCNECGLCLKICKEGALVRQATYNARGVRPIGWTGDCSVCGDCKIVCAEFAIDIR